MDVKRSAVLLTLAVILASLIPVGAVSAASTSGVRGTVTDVMGNPIPGIRVEGYVRNDEGYYIGIYSTVTDASGVYEITRSTPGGMTIKLYFHEYGNANWIGEWHYNKHSRYTADPVVVPSGVWVTIDAVLTGPSYLSGRVTEAGSGAPIEGILVTAYSASTAAARGATTDLPSDTTGADGTYEIKVAPGPYRVLFNPTYSAVGWAHRWTGGGMIQNQASVVTVPLDGRLTLNAALVPGGSVALGAMSIESGKMVYDDRPDGGFCYEVYATGGSLVAARWVGPEDHHWFGLPPGSYQFRFVDCDAPVQFVSSWYPNSVSRAGAEPLTVATGEFSGYRTIDTAHRCAGSWPTLIGTWDDDTISGTAKRDVIVTGKGNDSVLGKGGHDLICLGEGDDFASGGPGLDEIYGNEGDDFLRGGDHADTLYGGDGIDRITGDGGSDTIRGNQGGDQLGGGPGVDTVDGGSGRDTVTYSGATGPVRVSLAAGSASGEGPDTLLAIENVIGSRYIDRLIGDAGPNRLVGGAENDTILGGGGDDNLLGAAGDDVLSGGPGDDLLRGLRGNDTLNGGTGNDTLHGGTGSDTCTAGPVMTSC